jgi:hypothetical protein
MFAGVVTREGGNDQDKRIKMKKRKMNHKLPEPHEQTQRIFGVYGGEWAWE